MSTATPTRFDLDRFVRAAQERDAATQLAMYGPEATVTIVDKISQPGSPRLLRTHRQRRASSLHRCPGVRIISRRARVKFLRERRSRPARRRRHCLPRFHRKHA